MKSVFINKDATIVNGKLAGFTSRVVAYNCLDNEVQIEYDKYCTITTTSENIIQK